MKIKNVAIDTADMSYEEVDSLIQSLRAIRTRKAELRNRMNLFRDMIDNMRSNEGMTFVSKTTGEVLDPDDWDLYDETIHSFYVEQERD